MYASLPRTWRILTGKSFGWPSRVRGYCNGRGVSFHRPGNLEPAYRYSQGIGINFIYLSSTTIETKALNVLYPRGYFREMFQFERNQPAAYLNPNLSHRSPNPLPPSSHPHHLPPLAWQHHPFSTGLASFSDLLRLRIAPRAQL